VDIDNEGAVVAAKAQQSRIEEIPDEDAIPLPQEPSKRSTSTLTPTQLQPTKTPEHPY
jgi:hypothetical protein